MNPFKQKLLDKEKLIGFEVDLCEPCICEMAASCGFDFVWVDTEHQAIDYQTVLNHIIACKAGGAASLVRIPQNEPFLAKRILEMGPDGIIFPNINSAPELKKAMDACLYPPKGRRGFGPKRACGYGRIDLFDYIKDADDSMCRFAQIESIDAVNNLDEMLTVPGCDGFIIGPCDLSGSIGLLNQTKHPKVMELIDLTVEKCRQAGRPIGIAAAYSPEDVQFWHDHGLQFICAGTDTAALIRGMLEQVKVMGEIFKKS